MKEQSHKDEMSAALRGDFARLRDRGVAATLAPRDRERPEDAPVDVPAEPTREPEDEEEPPAAEEPVVQPGFFARLLGR